MEFEKVIRSRRAIREYTSRPVVEDQLRSLIELAVQAPSAMNRQPWSFYVVRDQAVLQRVSDEAKQLMLRRSPSPTLSGELRQMLASAEFHIFYHAPALVVIAGTSDDPWSRIDCTLAAENLMLAAANMGLGTCWIGFAQAWLETEAGKAALGIPASSLPVAPVIVGHPNAAADPVPRNEAIIHWIG